MMVDHSRVKTYGVSPNHMAHMVIPERQRTPMPSRSMDYNQPISSGASISGFTRTSSVSSSNSSIPQRSLSMSSRHSDSTAIVHMGAVTHTFDTTVFSKSRREYCVLTHYELLRFKTSQKANQFFDFTLMKKRPNVKVSKSHHMLSKEGIIGVHYVPQSNTTFRIEHVDPLSKVISSICIFTSLQQDAIGWVNALRRLAQDNLSHISPITSAERSMAIERMLKQRDTTDPVDEILVKQIVLKHQRQKPTSDNPHASKEIIVPVTFAIGKSSFYILPHGFADDEYKKVVFRDRHGLLTIQHISYSGRDDSFELTVRNVAKDSQKLLFVSSHCEDIIRQLRVSISNLVPFYPIPPYTLDIVDALTRVEPTIDISKLGDRGFDALLEGYCAAMNLDKRRFSFTISSIPDMPGARHINVNPPNEINESPAVYSKYELLAVFRALRHNVTFRDIDFSNVNLHPLEQWPARTEDGWTNSLEGGAAIDNVLSSELWSLFMHNKKLRKIDFTNCGIGKCGGSKSAIHVIGKTMESRQIGLNAIHIGKNQITDVDIDALLAGVKANRKALKELSVAYCGLSRNQLERIVECILSAMPAHLRHLDLSHNYTYFSEELLSSLLRRCAHLSTLKMRKCNVMTDFNTLSQLHIQSLDVGRIGLSDHQVSTLCNWIQSPSFDKVRRLGVDNCGFKSRQVSAIIQAIGRSNNREVELVAGANPYMSEPSSLGLLWTALAVPSGPSALSLANTEWEDAVLHELFTSLTHNRTIKTLDLSGISTTKAISNETVHALAGMFEQNRVIEDLDLGGGENARGLGPALAGAFIGLATNTRLRCLRLGNLQMGPAGVIELQKCLVNNRTIQELHIDQNNLNIEAFMAIQKLVSESGSIIFLPRPNLDLRREQRRLDALAQALIESQSESQFLLVYSTGADARKAKSQFEVQTTARQATERDRAQIGKVVEDIMRAVAINKQRWNAQQATINPASPIQLSPGGLSPIQIPSLRERDRGESSSKITSFAGSRASQYSNMTGSDFYDSPNALAPITPLTPKPLTQSPHDWRYKKVLDRDDMEPLALGQAYLDAVDAYTSIIDTNYKI
ncbi:hypothetical protein INT44_001753 [Umbelopsis vinacea]|uniref:LRR-containing protein second PH domain-containing protein n=1 Tax=Umbelopsis vinacea TaxID=44442 RepID=A0A8H7PRJ2_9FUNG|nr:hypothetical protein INT44_001753 [Umbelopsis vinacea]